MTAELFLQPRLIGPRFEGHAIPLEFLKDLAVLEEMIVEVAKSEFFKEHPDRQRSPRGFTEGIELKLTSIDEGSAILNIILVLTMTTLFPMDNQQRYFEQAREAVVNAISAAEQNGSITDYLPEETLSYFDKMGRSLRDGEAIEFSTPDHPVAARLTKDTRRKLVLASSGVKELTEEVSIRGTVPEADQDNMTFHVQLSDGRKIRAPIATQHLGTIIDAFNNYNKGIRVMLQGIGRFNRNERLLSFDSVEHITVLDPLDVPARLDELRLLKNGWFEGRGQAPSGSGLDWLSQEFSQRYPENLQMPFLYPTPAGGVQAEWSFGPIEVTCEIDLGSHTAKWHALNMETDSEELRELNLDDAKDWEWLVEQITLMCEDDA